MKRLNILCLSTLLSACGADGSHDTPDRSTGSKDHLSPDPSPEQNRLQAPAEPTPLAPPRNGDGHGVVVAGGETYDFGAGSWLPSECKLGEPEPLKADAARSAWPHLEASFALMDTAHEAPLHYGYSPGGADPAPASADTTLTASIELLSVVRHAAQPHSLYPDATCDDLVFYDAVVELATADLSIAGRFYARFYSWRPGELSAKVAPDVRNFRGWLSFPVESERPHHAAVLVDLGLDQDGIRGNLDVAINYTDDNATSNAVPLDIPCVGGATGYLGAAGFWANDLDWTNARSETLPACLEGPMATLNDYEESDQLPTCVVELEAYVYQSLNDLTSIPPVASVSVNGEVVAEVAPELPQWSVPLPLGRLPVGSLVELEVSSADGTGIPHAGIVVDSPRRYVVGETCEEAGCTARAEFVIQDYCSY